VRFKKDLILILDWLNFGEKNQSLDPEMSFFIHIQRNVKICGCYVLKLKNKKFDLFLFSRKYPLDNILLNGCP